MPSIINRRAPAVVIWFSLLALSLAVGGCSGVFGESPREQADAAIAEANRSIDEHNRLFGQARDTYENVKESVESGGEPTQEDRDNVTQARNDLEQARGHLEDARGSLGGVQDLDVDPAVQRYAGLLSEAMDAQLAAEAREIEFYGILEEDPALQNNREEALNILSEVGDGYEEAESAYDEAQEVANSNPEAIEGGQ